MKKSLYRVLASIFALTVIFCGALQAAKAEDAPAQLYTLSFLSNSGVTISVPPQMLAEGEVTAAVPDPVKNGCKFIGWSPASNNTEPMWALGHTKMPGHDVSLYPHFAASDNEGLTLTIHVRNQVIVYRNLSFAADVIKFLPKINEEGFIKWTAYWDEEVRGKPIDLSKFDTFEIGECDMLVFAVFEEPETEPEVIRHPDPKPTPPAPTPSLAPIPGSPADMLPPQTGAEHSLLPAMATLLLVLMACGIVFAARVRATKKGRSAGR